MFRTLSCAVALCLWGCDQKTSAVGSPPVVTKEAALNTALERTSAPELPSAPEKSSAPEKPSAALHTPKKGSAERKAILDALRPWVEKQLGQEVILLVDHLAVKDGFAFLTGRPLQPNGKRIDYLKTSYKEVVEQGFFDDNLSALFRQEGSGWKLITSSLGSTDVPWVSWPKEHNAPTEIFPGGFN